MERVGFQEEGARMRYFCCGVLIRERVYMSRQWPKDGWLRRVFWFPSFARAVGEVCFLWET